MAQHIKIEEFDQPQMQKINESIRKQKYFKTSMKFGKLPDDYNETEFDEVYYTVRNIPGGIVYGTIRGMFEIHTKPAKIGREVTNIYLVA